MAEQQKPDQKTTEAPEAQKSSGTETNPGTPDTEAYGSSDGALAEAAGITEGEVHALRDDAGLNQLAGHDADVHAWSLTEAGKKFSKEEADRKKAAKTEEKAYSEQTDKNGRTEAEAKYAEAVKS